MMQSEDEEFADVSPEELADIQRRINNITELVENDDRFIHMMDDEGVLDHLQVKLEAMQESARYKTEVETDEVEDEEEDDEEDEEGEEEEDDEDEEDVIALDEDTYSLMIVTPLFSMHWFLGLMTLIFQYSILILILVDLIVKQSEDSSVLGIPYSVPFEVTVGQFLGIFICVGAQSDVLSSTRMLIALNHSAGSNWGEVVGIEKEEENWKNWIIQVFFPLFCKFGSGIIILTVNFITIVQSDNIVDLTKDVGALLIISEIPEVFFGIARFGFLGNDFYDATLMVEETEIPYEFDFGKTIFGIYFPARAVIFCTLVMCMCTAVGLFLEGQISGKYFFDRYPYCTIPVLNISNIGDGKCEGGIYNTIDCDFDGGDCLEFNMQYPNCKALDPFKVGDGTCDQAYNIPECNFDGNDCCPFDDGNSTDPRLGDGMCDGGKFFAGLCDLDAFDCTKLAFEAPNCDYDDLSDLVPFGEEPKLGDGKCESRVYNTPECLFENGDCKECNSEVFDYTLTGDGICHGGPHNTEVCNYDAGDCESFNRRWPRCHLNAKGKYPDKVEIVPIIGDGICNSGLYNNQQCGFEDGDCLLCNSIVPNITKIGDGFCDGQQYMSDVCGFDGGDCLGCNALRFEIGDGWCSPEYNIPECSYDGGDCDILRELGDCDVPYPSLLGNGYCNGAEYNTEECNWDGGDCLDVKLDGCDDPERRHFLLGDDYCHGFMNTPECNFDGGDCLEFNAKYPNCTFDDMQPGLIGDGSCDGGRYNSLECGWDGGDCTAEL